jgi:hypothetical protein
VLFQHLKFLHCIILTSVMLVVCSHPALADPESIEKHVSKLLDTPADSGKVQVIQTRHDTYRMQVETGLLLDAIKQKPNGSIIPRTTTLYLKAEDNGAWSFTASQPLSASWHTNEAGKTISSVLNVRKGVVSGSYRPDGNSKIWVSAADGAVDELADGYSRHVDWQYSGNDHLDVPLAKGRSTTVDSGFVQTLHYRESLPGAEPTAGYLKRAEFKVRAVGVNFAAMKSMLAYGDRLELHSSEGEPGFPVDAIVGASKIDIKTKIDTVTLRLRKTGPGSASVAISSIAGALSVNNPIDYVENKFFFDMDGINFNVSGPGRETASLFPTSIMAQGGLSGLDSRVIYLHLSKVAQLGVNNGLDYLNFGAFPSRKLEINDFYARIQARNYRATLRGYLKIDLDHAQKPECEMTARSPDIDRLIAVYKKAAKSNHAVAQLQFLLYFLKGAGKKEANGDLSWSISAKDGKSSINGVAYKLPDFKLPPLKGR